MKSTFWRNGPGLAVVAVVIACGCSPDAVHAANDAMTLSVTNYEAGISYRDVQWHAPIGMITNSCSQADFFAATIDWGDGTGERKPDTNIRLRPFSRENQIPVVDNGTYLFWDDTHAFARAGTYIAKAKVTQHCLGDPPGNQESVNEITVNAYPRIPVNQVEFRKNQKKVERGAGHDNVDLAITLDAPAPPSGTWVKLDASPEGTFNSLPPYYRCLRNKPRKQFETLKYANPQPSRLLW